MFSKAFITAVKNCFLLPKMQLSSLVEQILCNVLLYYVLLYCYTLHFLLYLKRFFKKRIHQYAMFIIVKSVNIFIYYKNICIYLISYIDFILYIASSHTINRNPLIGEDYSRKKLIFSITLSKQISISVKTE